MTSSDPRLDGLVDVVLEDVRQKLRRIEDRELSHRRVLIQAAEDHVQALEAAAAELGQLRGQAVETSADEAAQAEVKAVVDAAFERLTERFLRRVRLALDKLPDVEAYADVLATWARQATRRMDGPVDVFTAPRDRRAVYEAFVKAGAEDFQVQIDRRIACGFVVRDPDGRTQVDRRPEALVEARKDDLIQILAQGAPPPPGE